MPKSSQSTVKNTVIEDSSTLTHTNSGTNTSHGGLLNDIAAGNGSHNYGPGLGNANDFSFTPSFTAAFQPFSNSFSWLGTTTPVTTANTTPTTSTTQIHDNDIVNNSNTGTQAGNGNAGGLLNGIAAGNGEHNYGVGNGNADDASVTVPWTTPVQAISNSIAAVGGADINAVNTSPTTSSTQIQDNDTTNNSILA